MYSCDIQKLAVDVLKMFSGAHRSIVRWYKPFKGAGRATKYQADVVQGLHALSMAGFVISCRSDNSMCDIAMSDIRNIDLS
jgi:hypothetical protein